MANELWQQAAGTFDLAAGVDEPALNALTASIYTGIYPHLLKGSVHIGQLNISTIDYDIQAAPTIELNPSQFLMDLYRPLLGQQLQGEELEISILEAAQASFAGTFSVISVTINYSDGQPPTGPVKASMTVAAQAMVNPDNSLIFRLLQGKITIQGNPVLSELLTKVFVPLLVNYLNANVLAPIALPPLKFPNVSFSTPVVITQSGALVVFSALQPNPVEPPPPSPWPPGVAFIAADAPSINAVANAAFAYYNPSGDWSWSTNIAICDVGVHAQYYVKLGGVSLNLVPGSGNSVTVSLSGLGGASFSAGCGFLSWTFGANISASLTATAAIWAVGQEVVVTFGKVDDISVHLDFYGVPGILAPIIGALASAFIPAIVRLIASYLAGFSFELFTIPAISFAIGGLSFTITLKDLALQTISGPSNVPLLTVTGLADVQTGPKITHSVRNISARRLPK